MTQLEDDELKDKNTTTAHIATAPTSIPSFSKSAEPIAINNILHTTTATNIPSSNINLSPAVSAFQQFWPSSGNLAPGTSSSSSSLSSSPLGKSSHGNNTLTSQVPSTQTPSHGTQGDRSLSRSFDNTVPIASTPLQVPIKDGYVYKDKIVILDQEKKEQLLKVGTIVLQGEWTYWYDRYVPNLPASEYEANLQIISTVGTVQKFWSVYNNIDGPEKLGFRSNLHFMRKGIKPIWEDPKNEYGGSYNFKVTKAQSPLVWRDLLVLLIGEKIEQWLNDTVCGVSVSSRQHCDNYQIWVSSGQDKSDDNQGGTAIKAALVDLLGPVDIQSFYFKIHKNHAAFQKDGGPTQQPNRSYGSNSTSSNSNSNSNNSGNGGYVKYRNSNGSPMDRLPPHLTEMRRKITEENIEKVVADIERLSMKQKSIRKIGSKSSIASTS